MNQLSPQTIQLLLARRDPGTIQAMVQRGIISPQMAQQAMQTPPQGAGAMAPTPVAGDATLGSTLAPLGSGSPQISAYQGPPPQSLQPFASAGPVPMISPADAAASVRAAKARHAMAPASSASPAPPPPPTATVDGTPTSTVSDLHLGGNRTMQYADAPIAAGFQSNPLPNFGQMGRALISPTNANAPNIDYTNPEVQETGVSSTGPAGPLPTPTPQAAPSPASTPPTPTQQADNAFPFKQQGGGDQSSTGGLPPPRMVGARTVQTVDPAVYQREMRGTEEEKTGRLAENQAQADAATKQAEVLGNEAGQHYVSQFQEESKARKLRAMYADHATSMEQDRLEMAKAQPDYNRVFRGRPVLGALAAVAQGLGAAGAALTHTPNTAAQILSDFVDRDVEQQKAAYQQKKESLQAKNSIFAEKMQSLGDPNAAEAAAKAHELMAMSLLAQREAAKSGSAELQARATTIAGLLDQGSAQHQAAMEQRLQAGIVGGVSPSTLDQKLYVPRAGGVALNEQEAEKLRESGSGYAKLQAITDQAIALRRSLGANPMKDYEIYKQLKQLEAQAQPALQETNNFKRLSAEDEKVNKEMLGQITGIAPGTLERLQQMKEAKLREEEEKYKAAGIARSIEGYTRNARGEVVRVGALTGQDYQPTPRVPTAGEVR
jgi:hypothetical protein